MTKITDKEIDFSDIPETNKEFWENAKIVKKKTKKPITIRIDEDIINFFKNNSTHYQSFINEVLKSYMLAHK